VAIDVRVKAIDNVSPFAYPNRRIELRTSLGIFSTPIRAATYYEYRAKQEVPAVAPIDSPIMVNIKKLNSTELKEFTGTNERYGSLLRTVEHSNRIGQYCTMRIFLLQPTTTIGRGRGREKQEAAMTVLRSSPRLLQKFLRLNIQLQMEAGLEAVAIPSLDLPYSNLKSIAREVDKYLKKVGKEPIFFVDIRYKDFVRMLRVLADELDSRVIGLIHRRFRDFPQHYEILREYYDRDIAFFNAQTSRYDIRYDDISTMHYMPFLGNDIYSVEVPPPPFEPDAERTETRIRPNLANIRIFDKKSLKVKPITSFSTDAILSQTRFRDEEIIRQILDNRQEVNRNNAKYRKLNHFSRVHEHEASLKEFEVLRKCIEENTTKDYLESRDAILPVLSEIPRTSRINQF
jgi:hypothetical protein